MYCPMMFNQISGNSQGFGGTIDDRSDCCICKGNNCAWWMTYRDQGYCAITNIAITLEEIIDKLKEQDNGK